MANTGDARVVIQMKNGEYRQTTDHKPNSEEEQRRLRENFNTEVYEFGGIMRVNGQLAVSRAIGDIDYKIYGVLSLPQIYDEVDLKRVDFIVVACDGMWDVLQTEQVTQIVQFCLGRDVQLDPDTKLLASAAKLYIDQR